MLVGKERHALVVGMSMYTICIYTSAVQLPSNSVSASAKGSVGSSMLSARKEVQARLYLDLGGGKTKLTAPRPCSR